MNSRNNSVWFVGNSQLHLSVIKAFCSPEVFKKCGEDWSHGRISKGEFLFEEQSFNFLFCNMGLLGPPSFDGVNLSFSETMMNFVNSVESDAAVIVVMLRGNEFALESLVDEPTHWDFSYKGAQATKGRQFVRIRDLRKYFQKRMNSLFTSCLLYRINFPSAVVYHVAAPPPIESEDHIRGTPEIFGALFDEFGVRPFLLRKKIYDLMYDILAEELNKIGVQTIFAPQESLSDAGGLKCEFTQ
jgi:hypothetical protein